MNNYDGRLIDGKKLIKKFLQNIDRFSYSEKEGNPVLDRRGYLCFVNDVVNIINKEMSKE
jgi:hypothetical protein